MMRHEVRSCILLSLFYLMTHIRTGSLARLGAQ